MTELLEAVASWPSLVFIIVVFGFAPGFCLRLIVLAYPRRDPRRAELIAELYAVPRIQRPLWVAEQVEVALFEGLRHRILAAFRRSERNVHMAGPLERTWINRHREQTGCTSEVFEIAENEPADQITCNECHAHDDLFHMAGPLERTWIERHREQTGCTSNLFEIAENEPADQITCKKCHAQDDVPHMGEPLEECG